MTHPALKPIELILFPMIQLFNFLPVNINSSSYWPAHRVSDSLVKSAGVGKAGGERFLTTQTGCRHDFPFCAAGYCRLQRGRDLHSVLLASVSANQYLQQFRGFRFLQYTIYKYVESSSTLTSVSHYRTVVDNTLMFSTCSPVIQYFTFCLSSFIVVYYSLSFMRTANEGLLQTDRLGRRRRAEMKQREKESGEK